ncbi:MAG TPA: Gfo/Idh/MocA family oxidoreductase [Candidatus Alectryocaccobium stercorigallinarum]|jgi:myo-inositol 2-dehydrogenase/D-chiro-inositol 1-dehydrogenase|nr:Gfo/Idh/MocA family oxidoreductase [Candidatus Alectryocaccobium stercorigallinarum]
MAVLKIGVAGTGRMGINHIERIHERVADAKVYAIASGNISNAEKAAGKYDIPNVCDSGESMIETGIDAMIVASSGASHESYVRACIKAGIPVFCEKPLSDTKDGCIRLMELEAKSGKQLIQVGFMRHFDTYHNELKEAVSKRELGEPLIVHAVHRNPTAANFDDRMQIMDAAIHMIDVIPWILGGDKFVSCNVVCGKSTPLVNGKYKDPQIIIFETESGVIVEFEIFTNCQYGFDTSCEVVCERGTISLPQSTAALIKVPSHRQISEYSQWHIRHSNAFDKEIWHFIDGVRKGVITGPTAWEAYAASEVGEACLESLKAGGKREINYIGQPELYR